MEMKGMMFAGGGLALAMTVTTLMMSGDVSRMREQERAIQAKECAALASEAAATPAAGTTDPYATPTATAPSTAETDFAKRCPDEAAAASAGTGATGATDPATGAFDRAGDDAYAPEADAQAYDDGSTYDGGSTYDDGAFVGEASGQPAEAATTYDDGTSYGADGNPISTDIAPGSDSGVTNSAAGF